LLIELENKPGIKYKIDKSVDIISATGAKLNYHSNENRKTQMKNLNPNSIKSNVTVFLEVFNEEHRLEACLKNFQWADELVVFVKKSSDNTLDIAKKYATHVYEGGYELSKNFASNVEKHQSKEWCLCITASSLIDPELVVQIEKLTCDANFNYDVIGLPYKMYAFGLTGPCSPWGADYKYQLIRRSALHLTDILHNEIGWIGDNVYTISTGSTIGRFYHCTHSDPDDFFLRHMRYVKYEAKHYCYIYGSKAFRKSLVEFLRSIASVIIKKKSIWRGRDGFVLSLAYVSYFLMRMIYVWYGLRSCDDVYSEIRKASVAKWSRNNAVKD